MIGANIVAHSEIIQILLCDLTGLRLRNDRIAIFPYNAWNTLPDILGDAFANNNHMIRLGIQNELFSVVIPWGSYDLIKDFISGFNPFVIERDNAGVHKPDPSILQLDQ